MEWGPRLSPRPTPHYLGKVGTFPPTPFLGHGLEGVRNAPPGAVGSPQILSIPRQRGPVWGWFLLPSSAGAFPNENQCL